MAIAREVIAKLSCSGRKACKVLKVSRSVFYYDRHRSSDKWTKLREDVIRLSKRYPTMGYKKENGFTS